MWESRSDLAVTVMLSDFDFSLTASHQLLLFFLILGCLQDVSPLSRLIPRTRPDAGRALSLRA